MKKWIQATLQRLLGFDTYLFVFSLFIMYTLRWNKKEGDFRHFLSLLAPDSTVLDIGANIGIMTALLSKACPQGKVHAFEPIPENHRSLQRLLRFTNSHNVHLHPIALGAERATVAMRMPVMEGVRMQGLTHVEHESIRGYEQQSIPYQVEQYALDDLQALKGTKVDAIKMDVENYEQYVLEGGRHLLRQYQPLIYCELWENENRKNCMRLLAEQGYAPYVLVNDQLVSFAPNVHPHQNFFFLPKKLKKEAGIP